MSRCGGWSQARKSSWGLWISGKGQDIVTLPETHLIPSIMQIRSVCPLCGIVFLVTSMQTSYTRSHVFLPSVSALTCRVISEQVQREVRHVSSAPLWTSQQLPLREIILGVLQKLPEDRLQLGKLLQHPRVQPFVSKGKCGRSGEPRDRTNRASVEFLANAGARGVFIDSAAQHARFIRRDADETSDTQAEEVRWLLGTSEASHSICTGNQTGPSEAFSEAGRTGPSEVSRDASEPRSPEPSPGSAGMALGLSGRSLNSGVQSSGSEWSDDEVNTFAFG